MSFINSPWSIELNALEKSIKQRGTFCFMIRLTFAYALWVSLPGKKPKT